MSGIKDSQVYIETMLSKKYENPFSFYRVKPINEMLYGYYHRKTHIDLTDVRIYSEQTQFLRRVYYYRTLAGREQIMQRLKMCGEYYSKSTMLTYQYPMMILTNTKNLFTKRNRRLRKINAGEASSDESEEEEQRLLDQLYDCDILDDLDRNSIDDIESEYIDDISYDSEQHDVFQNNCSQVQENNFCLNNIYQTDISHLITDLGHHPEPTIDLKQTKQVAKTSLNTLQNIENNLKLREEESISITPIDNHSLKSSTQMKTSNGCQSKGISLSKLVSKFDSVIDNNGKQGESLTFDTMNQKHDNQRLQLETRRRRIREKAEELLKKVRKEENLDQFSI